MKHASDFKVNICNNNMIKRSATCFLCFSVGAKVESAGEWTKICHSDKMGDDWGKNDIF